MAALRALSLWVTLDNMGVHVARWVRQAAQELSGKGLSLSLLPAYSPQPNDVEAVFQVVKHPERPERSDTPLDEWVAAVQRALLRHHLRLRTPGRHRCPGA